MHPGSEKNHSSEKKIIEKYRKIKLLWGGSFF